MINSCETNRINFSQNASINYKFIKKICLFFHEYFGYEYEYFFSFFIIFIFFWWMFIFINNFFKPIHLFIVFLNQIFSFSPNFSFLSLNFILFGEIFDFILKLVCLFMPFLFSSNGWEVCFTKLITNSIWINFFTAKYLAYLMRFWKKYAIFFKKS